MGAIKSYLSATASLWYAYLACLPLFVLYEILIWAGNLHAGRAGNVRLSAELWIQQLLLFIHPNTLLLSILLVMVSGGVIWYLERGKRRPLRPRWFLMMLLESAVWATLLAVLVSGVLSLLLHTFGLLQPGPAPLLVAETSITALSPLQSLALSLGAGLYEELVFRVVLVFGLYHLFGYAVKPHQARIFAIIIAAFLFSLVHYTGSLGDVFTLHSFLFRMIFGIVLNMLLLLRGFGITAWTHALYDVFVMLG